MTEVEKEKSIENYPKPITIEGTIKIVDQLKNCICKIQNKNGNGTGFFCEIPYKKEKLKVLITNNHIIDEEIIKKYERITVSLNNDKEHKKIELRNKKIYTNKEYDTTIIEINSEKKNINNYLELDEQIFEDNINNKSVYILQYPNYSDGQRAAVSYGIIKNIQDKFNLIHYCCTESGSSGSPILNALNNKIIGIHKESVKSKNYNRGTLLKYPINEYLNKYFNNSAQDESNLSFETDYNNNTNQFMLNNSNLNQNMNNFNINNMNNITNNFNSNNMINSNIHKMNNIHFNINNMNSLINNFNYNMKINYMNNNFNNNMNNINKEIFTNNLSINNDDKLSIIFQLSGKFQEKLGLKSNKISILCKSDDKITEVIKRYRSISKDNFSKYFLFNAKDLNPSLSVAEAGLFNCSVIVCL